MKCHSYALNVPKLDVMPDFLTGASQNRSFSLFVVNIGVGEREREMCTLRYA